MKLRLFLFTGVLAGCTWVWGADTQADLQRARANYQQAVSAHGKGSAQAQVARKNLRAARQNYHAGHRKQARRHTAD